MMTPKELLEVVRPVIAASSAAATGGFADTKVNMVTLISIYLWMCLYEFD